MKQLMRLQLISVGLYVGGIGVSVLLVWLARQWWGLSPVWLVFLAAFLCPLGSALLRLHTWKHRKKRLTEAEQNRWGAKVYFAIGYVEVLFAVLVMGFFLNTIVA